MPGPSRSAAGVALAALAVVAAGCGGGGGGKSHTTTTIRTVPTIPGSTRMVTMPDVTGQRLAPAARRARAIGFALNVTGPRGQRARGTNWTVCRTNPPAGVELPASTRIELVVARPGTC